MEYNPDLIDKWDKLKVDKEKLEKELIDFKDYIQSFLSDKGIAQLENEYENSEKLSEKASLLGE